MKNTDPLGKRALFSPPPTAPDHHLNNDPLVGGSESEGREAVFSTGPHRAGTVVLECSSCLSRTRMSTVEAGIRILFISAWIPGKRYSRWIQCPECERRTWCRIHWRG